MKSTLLTITLIALSTQVICQNSTMAKAYYKKALMSFENQEYKTALEHIESTKMELGGVTNPDVIYLEAKTRFECDVNVNRAKALFNEFLKEADEQDSRKDEIALILVDINSSNSYYENGNIAIRKSSEGNKVSTLIYDENGKRLCMLEIFDIPDFEVIKNTAVPNPQYPSFHQYSAKYALSIYSTDELNDVLQVQYYESLNSMHSHVLHSISIGGYDLVFTGKTYNHNQHGTNSYGEYFVSHPELRETEYQEIPLSSKVQSTLYENCGISQIFFCHQWYDGRWNSALKGKEVYNFSMNKNFTQTIQGYTKVRGKSQFDWKTKSWIAQELQGKSSGKKKEKPAKRRWNVKTGIIP